MGALGLGGGAKQSIPIGGFVCNRQMKVLGLENEVRPIRSLDQRRTREGLLFDSTRPISQYESPLTDPSTVIRQYVLLGLLARL